MNVLAPVQEQEKLPIALTAASTPARIRSEILAWERFAALQPQVEIPVTHTVNGDLYTRSIAIMKGVIATGAMHRHPTTHLVLKGRMTILTSGGGVREIKDGAIFVAPPGNKMLGVAHEDTIWATVHITKLRNIAEIEAEICFSPAEVELMESSNADHRDFAATLRMVGVPLEVADKVSHDWKDRLDFGPSGVHAYVAPSPIEGQGLFALRDIAAGVVIAPARRSGLRTPAGRFTNHALHPNSVMVMLGDDMDLVSSKAIKKDEEITLDYRQVFRARGLLPSTKET